MHGSIVATGVPAAACRFQRGFIAINRPCPGHLRPGERMPIAEQTLAEPATTTRAALHPPADAAASCVLTVLTLNIHKGFSTFNRRLVLHELRDAVRETGADLVFLQEVIGEHQLHSTLQPRWPQTSHYEFLADTNWSAFAYGRNAVYPEGHHGNALLSKYPIRHHANHDVSTAGREPRGLLHCVVSAPVATGELHLVCVHLDLHARQRRRQLGLLCELIAREVPDNAPLVVAGDFNDWTLHAHDRLRDEARLREIFVERRGKAARTFPARWPLLRLDRIYVRNVQVRADVVLSLRPWSHLSDHAGLLAEIAA